MKRDKPKLREVVYDVSDGHARRSCQKKMQYRNKGRAKEAASRQTKVYGRPISIYRCPCCQFYHLTRRQ